MRYFEITFEWFSRPLYRVGKKKTCKITIAAGSLHDAYVLAREEGKTRFPRHNWKVLTCNEITAMVAS